MQIRQTGQPIPVSKVETDRREEVKKIKPIGLQQIPDSFETGGAPSDPPSNSSASAEPEKKAGQITGGILIKQMTQARLADSGIKLTNEVKENSGVRDFNDTQQDQAEATTPQVNTKGNPRTPGAATDYGARVPEGAYTGDARSDMEKNKGALEDFFAQQNIDTSSGNGVDASDFGVGAGVDLGGGFNSGPQGPDDPMDNVNDQFARKDYLDGLGNAGNRLNAQMQDATQGMDGANMGHGNDMISIDLPVADGKTAPSAPTATKKGDEVEKVDVSHPTESQDALEGLPVVGDDIAKGLKGTKQSAGNYMQRIEDAANSDPTTDSGNKPGSTEPKPPQDRYSHHENGTYTRFDANGQTAEHKNVDGSREYFAKDKDGQWVQVSKKEYDKKKSGSMPNPENYVDPEAAKKVKEMDEMLKNLGLDGLWNLQRGPKDQGKGPDYGPEPVGTSIDDAGNGSLLSQFGKDGLVGNPNQQNHTGPSNSNFGGLPGETVTDPVEGELIMA